MRMNNIRQLLCMIDHKGIIQDIKGDQEEVFDVSPPMLSVGSSFYSVPWNSVFIEPFYLDHSKSQPLTTNTGKKVFFHYYPVKAGTSLFEGSVCTFTNTSPAVKWKTESSLILKSSSMQQIMTIIQNVSHVDSTILILGESGVGKSVLAKFIHERSKRNEGPFLSINCGTLPENLIESELFGYEAGTFTGGSNQGKKGLFEAAEKGSILLDEIAELPFFVQSKLLDVVQRNKIRKVGGVQEKDIDVRIMAATNKDLSKLVAEGKFREDLFYRLNVVPINIPPLRERKEDLPELIDHYLAFFNQKYDRHVTLSEEMIHDFMNDDWPGNIRELTNKIERIVVTNNLPSGNHALPSEERNSPNLKAERMDAAAFPSLKEAKAQTEKDLILKVYDIYKNTYKTAKILNVDQSTISKKIKKYRDEDKKEKAAYE
ncbi:Transcriptional regulator containing PAS, AAA-type ATPase, and DNA-binding Fis domains [Alteribacillus iranensis]|uniref:HTH-type transcriptional regulatory protein TyrR n=2 Tax=Alteribacillus iranensis TaxID=930128 RepID=A0A1I2BFZ9_9BACI|nr:Transcriptional regulator containing PAS, AAA-type ATPase, and DNA-binding Fis domains [Alteribacillus iranensis]